MRSLPEKSDQKVNVFKKVAVIGLVLLFSFCFPFRSSSYGVLSHEAIIDALWENTIEPLLKKKYPSSSPEELRKAHAYAYGGAIMPDIGYCPFGSVEFSQLVHYVRSGDFVTSLIEESESLYQYAFALGMLCHYESDRYGHVLGTNKAVAIMFPKMEKKYGNEITFEEARNPHCRMEFGFDMIQTARGNYASNAYHDFIGFEVNDTVLKRAFLKTYGCELNEVISNLPLAISMLRFSVKVMVPELTKAAWKVKNSFIIKVNPLATKKTYIYKYERKNYRKEFTQPTVPSVMISVFISVIPKVSTLSRFKPRTPNQEAEKLFEQSFDAILPHYAALLIDLRSRDISCANVNLDTGKETVMGDYHLADDSYFNLLMKLRKNKFENADEALKNNIRLYYAHHETKGKYGTYSRKGKKIDRALAQLNIAVPNPESQEH